jgi:anion-transporting  ArsA/GET3 family ATPase
MLFFKAFEGMEAGFRQRAAAVNDLLASGETAFVLVTSPGRDAVSEAGYFARRLRKGGLVVDGLVVNRVHPSFGAEAPEGLRKRAADLAANGDGGEAARRLAALYGNLADFGEVARRERHHLAGLEAQVGEVPVVHVPFLPIEVHDFSGLEEVGHHLLG